ncbi:serine hydrolase domain-containing protein [Bernardetia sp. ABR2-2B]|uniref:serine hydrolase domain-containing protein n=1 Tax=Bernardetia sp. ABR2-2B TaxID=3127472 RepID=UPI0030CB7C37
MKSQTCIIAFVFLFFQSLYVLGQNNFIEKPYQKIDSLFNSLYPSNKTGAAFAIIENGQTTYKNAKGLSNIEHQISITDSTMFHIASVSKQFTTFLALLLEKEGKLSFADDIRTHLPELKHLPNKITIKELTNHTHGLPNIHELMNLKGAYPEGQMTHKEVVKFLLKTKQTNFEPKEKYEYNNTGYILLAEIIERVGQKPFKEQLEEKIFLPLGMNASKAIDDVNILIKNKANSYRFVGNSYEKHPLHLGTIGSSGINTTINDLILWAKNYQSPKVGSREFYNKMEQATYLKSGKKINYGLGLQFGKYKGLDIVFHGGGDVAYRSYILHVPKHKLSIVILANTNDFSPLDMVHQTLDILLKDEIQEDKTSKTIITNEQLEKYEGTYEFYPSIYFTILAQNDTLFFQSYGTKEQNPLPSINKNTFEFPYLPHSKFTFYEDRFDFHIADFTYECKKITIPTFDAKDVKLEDFTGIFRNEEYAIDFKLVVENNHLVVRRAFDSIELKPFAINSFYSPQLGKLDFVYDENDKIITFKISGQNFKSVVFKKQ